MSNDSFPVRADFDMDPQHGPIIRVRVDGRWVSIYLLDETGVVTEPGGGQYGIEVKGPWWKFRQLVELPMLGDGAQWGSHGPAVSTLPDCMIPDGDSPCRGYLNLREKSEMMATALYRIGESTLVPGNWSVTDWPSLNGMVAAARDLERLRAENEELRRVIRPWQEANGVFHKHEGVDWPSAERCAICQRDKRIAELENGIKATFECANGRQEEWGDRAVEAFEILNEALRSE